MLGPASYVNPLDILWYVLAPILASSFIDMIDSSRLKSIPTRPGCYLFKNGEGEVLYVGKAASLRARLRSYFAPPHTLTAKTRVMMAQAEDVETIVTDSEVEALILENNLIKENRPKYNIALRDDKQYPYLCITLQEPYPRVLKVRRIRKDGAIYFGPYADGKALNDTLAALKKLFPYRSCDLTIPDGDQHADPVIERPCLEYFIKRCTAPCVRYTTREEYRAVIDGVVLFLQGKHGEVLAELNSQMAEAAEHLDFEKAAQIRDQIGAIERISERQKVTSINGADQDIVAIASDGPDACAAVFHVREGKVIGQDSYFLTGAGVEAVAPEDESDLRESVSSFVQQYYERAAHIPRDVVLSHLPEDGDVLGEWLSTLRGRKVTITVPQRGEKRRLVEMVLDNAREAIAAQRLRWMNDAQKTTSALKELQEALGLPTLPSRIECYDISNIQGTNAVGSMVVFEHGKPRNSEYRRFKIKTVDGPNDFASMAEMIARRFKRLGDASQDASFGAVPDLIIIDGGKGQLHAAQEALQAVGCGHLTIVSLAKRLEEIFIPGRPYPVLLPRTSQALYLVQRVRDEAHRFAITYHRALRSKGAVRSLIDDVPGVGPSRRKALIRAFGSVRGVKAATVEELARVPGISLELAGTIKEHLGGAS